MNFLKLTPILVASLVATGAAAAWLASRTAVDRTGFAGSAGVALWLAGFVLLALLVSPVAACVALFNRRKLSAMEIACGILPLPLLVIALLALFM
jgi:hypothetical protein